MYDSIIFILLVIFRCFGTSVRYKSLDLLQKKRCPCCAKERESTRRAVISVLTIQLGDPGWYILTRHRGHADHGNYLMTIFNPH